jgi:hypothetical protein
LRPGGTIVEATAGNTGLGPASVGARKGYRIVLIVPDKIASRQHGCRAGGGFDYVTGLFGGKLGDATLATAGSRRAQ